MLIAHCVSLCSRIILAAVWSQRAEEGLITPNEYTCSHFRGRIFLALKNQGKFGLFGTGWANFRGKMKGPPRTALKRPNFSILMDKPIYNMAIWSRIRILMAILDKSSPRTGRIGSCRQGLKALVGL